MLKWRGSMRPKPNWTRLILRLWGRFKNVKYRWTTWSSLWQSFMLHALKSVPPFRTRRRRRPSCKDKSWDINKSRRPFKTRLQRWNNRRAQNHRVSATKTRKGFSSWTSRSTHWAGKNLRSSPISSVLKPNVTNTPSFSRTISWRSRISSKARNRIAKFQ